MMLTEKSEDISCPVIKDGRIFVSPIIGCKGGCKYCYLHLRSMNTPHLNCLDNDVLVDSIVSNPQFIRGKEGTIISIGAWGDIFQTVEFKKHSLELILKLIKLNNPIQFMSKYVLDDKSISQISDSIQFNNQVLYSTTITTLKYWKMIEPFTASPIKRLETCETFLRYGVENNVLIKPVLPGITDLEITELLDLLKKHNIHYCVVGKLYYDDDILRSLNDCGLSLKNITNKASTLDCNGEISIDATDVTSLLHIVSLFREKGINAFLKSSCVNSNINRVNNPSNYFLNNNEYCINCGNCK